MVELFAAIALFVAGQQPGASSDEQDVAVGFGGKEPIDIAASRCEASDGGDTLNCTGTVRITQGDAILSAEEITVFGANSEAGFERIVGRGSVRFANGENKLSGDRADYDGTSTTLTVVGNVVVVQGTQVMTGGELIYNTVTRAMVFTPDATGRVRGLFFTGSQDQN